MAELNIPISHIRENEIRVVKLTLNIDKKANPQQKIHVRQGESNSTIIEIAIKRNGTDIEISKGFKPFMMVKYDDEYKALPCMFNNGVFKVILPARILASSGTLSNSYIILVNEQMQIIQSTESFDILIEEGIAPDSVSDVPDDSPWVFGGTNDYNKLINHPSIESVPLVGDNTFVQLGLRSLLNSEIENLLV